MSNITIYRFALDMTPGGVTPVVHLSQYDEAFQLEFTLYSRTGELDIPSGATAMIEGTKLDGKAYSANATISGNVVTVAGDVQISAVAGNNPFQIVLKSGNSTVGSANFTIAVERAAMDYDTVSDSKLAQIQDVTATAAQLTAAAENVTEGVETFEALAESVSDVLADITDDTLSITDKAADAAAVGNALAAEIAPKYSTSATYTVGDYVLYNNALYRCNTAIATAESWTAAHWTAVKIGSELGNLKSEINELDEATESIFDSWLANNVSLTENQYKSISIVSHSFIDAGGAFYVSDAISVSEGDVYKISCSGYGNAAAYAFGNSGVLSSVFPPSTASTSEAHVYVDKNIIIPAGVTELYLAKYTSTAAMSCAKLVNMPQVDTIVLSKTYSETYSELPTNPVRVPIVYNFEKGKTYKIKLTATDVNLKSGETNQVLLDSSTSASISASTLVDRLLSSGSANSVVSGTSWTINYTPTIDGIVSLLLRYKTSTGTQIFDAEIFVIDTLTTILDAADNVTNKITQIPNQSRMQFGAHRGAESFAPPNSVAAYEIAGKMGFQWAWLAQIRWSASKTLYVMHDEDVSITTNGTGNLSELSDEYIESLLCNKISGYDYSQFTNSELRVPTLEKVIQICVKYGMKMCFRIEPFPSDMSTDDNTLIWNNFANLIKEYNITDGIYSGYNSAEMKLCRTLIGENENLCPFRGNTTSGQDYIDFFETAGITGKRSVLLYYENATFADIKLLHKNGIEVYVFYNGTRPTMAEVDQWASWGVEILQNPSIPKLTIDI